MSDKKSTQGAGSPLPPGASQATPDNVKAKGTDPVEAEAAAPAPAGGETTAPATGLPDLEAHTEAPAWLSGDDAHDGKVWDGAFEAEPGETPAAGSAAEPELTNPDDVTLETPSLEKAGISSDAAEAASLSDATAEVKEVEAQAADAAVLTDPAANHPAAVNHTEGIAAAAPMTGDSSGSGDKPAAEPDAGTDADTGADAETGTGAKAAEESKTPAGGSAAVPAAGAGTAAGAAPEDGDSAPGVSDASRTPGAPDPDGSRRSRRTTDSEASAAPAGNGRNKRLLLIIGILGVLAVLVVLFFTVILGSSEKEPGVLEEDVAPIELETGACLQDFAGINEPTTVVTCETPHNAQLVATDTYPDSDEFPGTEALSSRATEICSDVRYSDVLAERGDLDLQENKVIPTPESWRDGDRRIDCFVVTGADQELTESLLEQ